MAIESGAASVRPATSRNTVACWIASTMPPRWSQGRGTPPPQTGWCVLCQLGHPSPDRRTMMSSVYPLITRTGGAIRVRLLAVARGAVEVATCMDPVGDCLNQGHTSNKSKLSVSSATASWQSL